MILKIEENDGNWVFVGEVEECTCTKIVCETESGNEELRKKFWKKDFSDSRPWGNAIKNKTLKLISYIRKGQEAEFILLDVNEAYLLSETGKTIERL